MTGLDLGDVRLGPKLVEGRVGNEGTLGALAPREGAEPGGGFSQALFDAMERVDALQQDAQEKSRALARGDSMDVHELMVAMGKSEVAFNLMLEVRNKIVDAW